MASKKHRCAPPTKDSIKRQKTCINSEESSLVFGIRAKHVAPGRSVSRYETVHDPEHARWKTLDQFQHWRRVLSSFYETPSPLVLDGHQFKTVEHYLQFRKASLHTPALACHLFCCQHSTHKIALGAGLDAFRARKQVRLTASQWASWESTVRDQAKDDARKAKFAPGSWCAQVLCATFPAQLWHVAPRCKPIRMLNHEQLRAQLLTPSSLATDSSPPPSAPSTLPTTPSSASASC